MDRTRQVPDGDLDIYRSAKTLMDNFGTIEVEIHVAQRADELRAVIYSSIAWCDFIIVL